MNIVYLLTGSNQGDRADQLSRCCTALQEVAGEIVMFSAVYETEAWGIEGLPAHLNQALCLHTRLTPLELIKVIHEIEYQLGRRRAEKWGVRSIDIDIIYFNNDIVQLPELVIPHPLLQERKFVLTPLCEIAPDFVHPVLLKTNKELELASPDKLQVSRVNAMA